MAAFKTADSARERRKRAKRLRKLVKSHERWLAPVEKLSGGLGHLWLVPIPIPVWSHALPAAPAGAAVLLAWVMLLGGDQLDAKGYPNFRKGVVRRAGGE